MPVLFVHGTSVRREKNDPDPYDRNVATRNDLMNRFLLKPLQRAGYKIYNPYVGALGCELAWNGASIPKPNVLQDLSVSDTTDGSTPKADSEQRERLLPDANRVQEEGDLHKAFEKDPQGFLEAVISPVLYDEIPLADSGDPNKAGAQTAGLIAASRAAALDPNVQIAALAASTDKEMLKILATAVEEKFRAGESGPVASPVDDQVEPPSAPELEQLGWWDDIKDRVSELFDRAGNIGVRTVSLTAMGAKRQQASMLAARFLGDIFLYLHKPKPVQDFLLQVIKDGCEQAPGEPWILMAHSLGGEMLYDVLVSRQADLPPGFRIDALITAGSQVGAFEEMKLLQSSNPSIKYPNKVTLPPGVTRWINIYDPNDFIGFSVSAIFDGAEDEKYSTGGATPMDTHGDYFLRPTFWDLLYQKLK